MHTVLHLSRNSVLPESSKSALQRNETITTISTKSISLQRNENIELQSNENIALQRYETISNWTFSLSTSLRSHLSSCNTALQRKECDAVAFSSGSKSCVMGVRSYAAGLGHQISEVLMWLRYAHLENSSHFFELFGPVIPAEHGDFGDPYEFANSFFGLRHAVQSMHSYVVDDVKINLSTAHRCDVVKRPVWSRCETVDCEDVSCFASQRMVKLFATYAPCLRQSALCFGDWVSKAQALPFDAAVVNIVWHIRAGDKWPYEPSSRYFREVFSYMLPFMRERRAKHWLVGGDVYHFFYLGVPYWNLFESMIAEYGLSSTHEFITKFLTVQESLLYMMAADVLVSTSSSFSDIAALFSAFPVVINPPPMHGFSSSWIEYLPDGIFVDGWTMSSKPDYVQNIYRSANITPAQAVSDALLKRLEIRFPASKR